MKKMSLLLSVYMVTLLLSSCEPARPGGGDIAPTTNYQGDFNEPKEVIISKKDSSVERALMEQDSAKKK